MSASPSCANLRMPSWSLSFAISSSQSAQRNSASLSTYVTLGICSPFRAIVEDMLVPYASSLFTQVLTCAGVELLGDGGGVVLELLKEVGGDREEVNARKSGDLARLFGKGRQIYAGFDPQKADARYGKKHP